MEKGRSAERMDLRQRGRRALLEPLAHGDGVPGPSSARVQVTLSVEPSFTTAQSWSVIESHSGRTGANRLFVRRVVWGQAVDFRRFADPMVGLREGFHTRPTIEVMDVDLDVDQWASQRAKLESLSIGRIGWEDGLKRISIDGVHYGLRLFLPVELTLCWSNNPPEGWAAIEDWFHGAVRWLEAKVEDVARGDATHDSSDGLLS